ncbi:UDP-N-acetylmuramoyl-tripeptide--D-alanyl-D-alanine ligase [Candidatus Phycosocius spiralis]|uniref:UDP-N-acetylmuramoyl-tripeptide--D-alanyl-D-alanine ligase n=1 Tax=Candidatus Phycosocius spiralis TaxID=2815099 RepID=A0ABQ4PTC0_9PROT|nr:UDP-N-acetylmuramoyl-tripeptide--D-alanyl-D-alanine ligase [Candidatus Phycosocius spiralis]GIU66255.1 UDP-N-acetylmuramoyl-tripeptide--D-alanyl-D-alanine ligase [Candidatus Phycosocius spiralis]
MTEPLWTSAQAALAVGGKAQGTWVTHGVCIDSRAVEPGDLFVALKAKRDGHSFVSAALAAGAGAAMVVDPSCADADAPLLIVPDTLLALENLATQARRRNVIAKRVAITGSVGKTTVKEMTAAALAQTAKTHFSVKSYNNHWGVPLTLARMPADARFGVFEIGMNHGGEIARLAPQVRPHIAAITTIAPVHIEHFDDEAGIADAKAEIFLGLDPGGTAVIPGDNPYAARLASRARDRDGIKLVTFGTSQHLDAHVVGIDTIGAERRVTATIMGQSFQWHIKEPGDHWIHNGLCALTLAVLAGGDGEASAMALSQFGAMDGRGISRPIFLAPGEFFVLVDEAYNANPTSMAGAIATLAGRSGTRRLAVLGDMLELGVLEDAFHSALATELARAKIDLVFCAGTRMKHLWDALLPSQRGAYASTASELAPIVANAARAGDVIMVKGSNGSRISEIVRALSALETTSGDL